MTKRLGADVRRKDGARKATTVIPMKMGIQRFALNEREAINQSLWIPAFAGMTTD
jgi:hypothetical protein